MIILLGVAQSTPLAAGDLYGDALPTGAIARLGTLRLRHVGHATGVAFSGDGKAIASVGDDGRLVILDLASGALEADVTPTGSGLYDVAFSPSGTTLAIATMSSVVLWDRARRTTVREFPSALFGPFSLSPTGQLLALVTAEGVVSLIDVATGSEQRRLDIGGHISSVAFSRDGKTVVVSNRTATLHLWGVADGSNESLTVEKARFVDASFDAEGALAAAGFPEPNSSNGAIWIWDHAPRRERHRIRLSYEMLQHKVRIAFSGSERLLASMTGDGTLRTWNADSGEQMREFPIHGFARRLVFSADGTRLAAAADDGGVRVWNTATWQPQLQAPSHRRSIHSLAFSRNGQRLASGSWDATARLWDVATGTQLLELGPHELFAGHKNAVTAVALAEESRAIVSGSWNFVRFWDADSGELRAKVRAHQGYTNGMAVLPDGRTVVTGGDHDAQIRFWDASTGLSVLELDGRDVIDMACAGDGQTLVTAGSSGELRVWRRSKGAWGVKVLPGHLTARRRRNPFVWESMGPDSVSAVAISRDGRTFASSSINGSVYLWDAATDQRTRVVVPVANDRRYANPVHSLALSNDGSLLVWPAGGGSLIITEVSTLKTLATLRGTATALAFAPDGRHLATGSADGTILIWDLWLVLGPAIAR